MKTIAKKNLPERLRQVDLVGDRSESTIPRFLTGSARNLIFTTLGWLWGCQIDRRPGQGARRTSDPLDWLWAVWRFSTAQKHQDHTQPFLISKFIQTSFGGRLWCNFAAKPSIFSPGASKSGICSWSGFGSVLYWFFIRIFVLKLNTTPRLHFMCFNLLCECFRVEFLIW